jgi:D-serine deaminase-like pyridoxal phosphate-dependent protein
MTDFPATPFLLVDGEVVRRNIERLAEYGRQHDIDIRPHAKTHKSLRVAEMQLDAGAVGLTTAKAGEAAVMAAASDDLLVAYPALDPARTERLAKLALHKTVRVAVDSRYAAEALAVAARRHAVTIGLLIDLDVGSGRTGLQSPEATLPLAQHIDGSAGVRLDGLFLYPGHIKSPPGDQHEALLQVSRRAGATLDLWGEHGLEASIVSAGSTPTAFQSHQIGDVTEIRPGTYVYNDMNCVRGGYCALEDCAAQIVTTVVSNAVPDQVVLDAGSKTLTSDLCGPAPDSGHGYVVEYPEAVISRLSEEHAQVDVSRCEVRPSLGERLTIIPNHICVCVNMQDRFWWSEGDDDAEPLPVDARGMLS